MDLGMTTRSPELKAAYERLDETIREVIRLEEWEGLVTDWVVVAANQYFTDEGRAMTDVGQILPGGGDTVPLYRVIGLLDYALTGCRDGVGYVPEADDED